METGKYIDKVHEITDLLEKNSTAKRISEIQKINAFYDGYNQACEDFFKQIRNEVPIWLKEVGCE